MRKITAFVVAALLAVSVLTGCAGSEPEHFASKSEGKSTAESSAESAAEESGSSTDTAHYPVTVSNFNYAKEAVEYTYEKAPERVIKQHQRAAHTGKRIRGYFEHRQDLRRGE